MASPYFDFGGGDDSRFLDLYSRFAGTSPEFGQYLDPNDPEVIKYQQLAASPTGSEDLISDYVGRRPSYEDYSPGLGRKMAAFLLGTLSGDPSRGYQLAQKHLYTPYEQALEDWKGEGTGITARARLMDAERSRELAAEKFGLQQRAGTARAKSIDESKRQTAARALADKVAAEERNEQARADRLDQQDWRRQMSEQIFEANQGWRDTQHTLQLEREERYKQEADRRAQEAAEKDKDLGRINKKLSDYASQQGIDTSQLNAREIAIMLAQDKAANHPAFKDLLQKTPNGYKLAEQGTERARILTIYLENLAKRYLSGEFQ